MTLEIEFELCDNISYILYHNNMDAVSKAVLVNDGDTLEDLTVTITSDVPFFKPVEIHADRIAGRSSLSLSDNPTFRFDLDPVFFANLAENMRADVVLRVSGKEGEIASSVFTTCLLTYDMWPGLCLMPELISSFVIPHADSLSPLRARVSDILAGWGESSALDGYNGDQNRVMKMVAAVYAAVSECNINYSLPPTDFGENGQRIRMPDEVLSTRTGTCIDLAALFASLLESINLDPIIFFTTGHAFVGAHLVRDAVHSMVEFNNSLYRANINGNAVCAFECTSVVNSNLLPFDTARKVAFDNLANPDEFQCAVEIYNAHQKIRPLPIRRMEGTSWIVDRETIEVENTVPQDVGSLDTILEYDRKLTRVDKWKRELLDLTTRNYLLKMKLGAKMVPLLIPDICDIEDRLSDGKTFQIAPKPLEWGGNAQYQAAPFETDGYVGDSARLLQGNIGRGYVHTPLTEKETEKVLRTISRQANQDLEESGCNSLFLQIGTLKWYDDDSDSPNYAPLILVPIQMKKTIRGFTIEKLDEDTLFNVTLQEKLKQEYDLLLPIPDPLPVDESGVDVSKLIQTVRQAVKSRPHWEVFNGAGIGIFSFSQYAMWKDIDSNMADYRENPIVRGLADGVTYPPDHIEPDADPYKGCLVVPADGSQVKAINASLEHSFVMHGPPGTGKSQTITNMIANAMMNGKTVLFVAEKRAALEVVKNRLDKVGIGNHCLELHSNKSVKSEVLAQLRSAFNTVEEYKDSELESMKAKLERSRESLDRYAEELHRPIVAGYCMYDLISRYEDNDVDDIVEIRYLGSLDAATEESIEAIATMVGDAVVLSDRIADVDTADLELIGTDVANMNLESDAMTIVDRLRAASARLQSSLEALTAFKLPCTPEEYEQVMHLHATMGTLKRSVVLNPDSPSYPADITNLNNGLRSLVARFQSCCALWNRIPAGDLVSISAEAVRLRDWYQLYGTSGLAVVDSTVVSYLDSIVRYCNGLESIRSDLETVSRVWGNGIFSVPGAPDLYGRYTAANNAGFLKKGKARREFMDSVSAHLLGAEEKYELYDQSLAAVSRCAPVAAMLLSIASAPACSTSVLQDLCKDCTDVVSVCRTFGITYEEFITMYNQAPECRKALEAYVADHDAWKAEFDTLVGFLRLHCTVPRYDKCVSESVALCDRIAAVSGRLYDIAAWHAAENSLVAAGFKEVIPYVLEGYDEDKLIASAYRTFYKAGLEKCRKSLEGMRTFGPVAFEKAIKLFKKYDLKYMELNCNILKCHLFQNLPSNDKTVAGTETYTLLKATQATRMRKSIRSLISEIPNVLQKVCPCFLMSPLSVSQYLGREFPKFDLVIFDESSQITTAKAICALGRARLAVIAGDNKQLPPTSFFQKRIETDDEDDLIDVDSFLDDCLSLNMPETYLEWHYRSRHESLIAFSNRMYYDSKMLTFPSSNDREAKVSCVRVEDGLYERGSGRNVPEANAVVDEIHRRVMDPELSKYSIGVIAFSTRQQDCIQDILDDRSGKDSVFFERLQSLPEPVFIKNLETVQGDERDVILFSIGYGRNKDGVVYQNFGPLNQAGGGRRLNVAVSRARCEMMVFASLEYTDIKYTPTTGPGVRGMREFLRFASNDGRFDKQDRTVSGAHGSSILSSIASELQAAGYICHFGIGTSSFHVDIAVLDPKNEGHYILGILNDGESYCNSDNTRDREYARADVLERFGWNLMHVWSAEWYSGRDAVIDKILARLQALIEGKYVADEEDEGDDGPAERKMMTRTPSVEDSRRREYMPGPIVTDPACVMLYDDPISVIKAVIDAESPISEEYLVKLTGKMMGMKKISDNARQRILTQIHSNFVPVKNGTFVTYWATGADRSCEYYRVSKDTSLNRKIDLIPYPELRAAVVDTVAKAGSVELANAASAVARTLEFARTGAAIKEVIEKVIEMEVEAGGILLSPDGRLILR